MDNNSDVMLEIGADWRLKVIRIVPESICYGMFLIAMAALFAITRRRGFFNRKSNIFLIIASVLLFLGSTLFLCLDVADLIKRMEIILLENPDETSLQPKLDQANEAVKRLFWTEEILFIYMLSLGDAIVVWRTWAICVDRRKWVYLPLATLAGSAISAIFEMGCDIHTSWSFLSLSPNASPVGAKLCLHSDIASFSLSFATNIICTLLVAFQTVQYRKVMSTYLEKSARRTQIEKVLILLLESGFIYILLYLTQAVPIYGTPLSPAGLIVCNIFNAIVQQAAGLYPTLMIILVRTKKSVWDVDEISRTVYENAPESCVSRRHVESDLPALPKYQGGTETTLGREEKDVESANSKEE